MKMPKTPPDINTVWAELGKNSQRLAEVFGMPTVLATRGKYLHWDRLRYYSPPTGFSHEEWWFALKLQRRNLFRHTPLHDKNGKAFDHLLVDPIPEMLHRIDQGAGGFIRMSDQITNPETRDQYYVSSLIQEAITSSQLEGAATTRKIATEMILTGRPPRDRSERMIMNNFKTMQQIGKIKDKPLSRSLVFDIHRLVTEKTLDDSTAAGRFRRSDERIVIGDMYNEVFHDPPPADELEERMAAMCDFANGKTPDYFIHPAIRSIILHFWLAYDHPFIDGNGRTARALFYWSMLRNGFWLFEFISISQIILSHPARYSRDFLYTETDENDLTYFILYHLDVIRRAIKELHDYIERKTRRIQTLENQLRGMVGLNHRQRALISHALRHPHHGYTIKSHQTGHNVVYQTARTDLLDLQDRGLLDCERIGKKWYFTPTKNLEEKLAEL